MRRLDFGADPDGGLWHGQDLKQGLLDHSVGPIREKIELKQVRSRRGRTNGMPKRLYVGLLACYRVVAWVAKYASGQTHPSLVPKVPVNTHM
jgi:hypothetical protein